jgi:hypothetical protein
MASNERPKREEIALIPVTSLQFQSLGGSIIGCDLEGKSAKVFEDRVSFFGVTPAVCVQVWNLLQFPVLQSATNDLAYAKPAEHLLWALLFLKKYGDEREMSLIAGGKDGPVNEKTFRKWSHIFVSFIAGLLYDVVSLLLVIVVPGPFDSHSALCCCRLFGTRERRVTRGTIVLCQLTGLIAKSHTSRLHQRHSIPTSTIVLVSI